MKATMAHKIQIRHIKSGQIDYISKNTWKNFPLDKDGISKRGWVQDDQTQKPENIEVDAAVTKFMNERATEEKKIFPVQKKGDMVAEVKEFIGDTSEYPPINSGSKQKGDTPEEPVDFDPGTHHKYGDEPGTRDGEEEPGRYPDFEELGKMKLTELRLWCIKNDVKIKATSIESMLDKIKEHYGHTE